MNNIGTDVAVGQFLFVLIGGAIALWRFAGARGEQRAALKRVIAQVEPNGGDSLHDEVTALSKECRKFHAEARRRLTALEAKQ